ncbi:hypothetical protein DIT71_15415 [Marinobacter vulgaris]|uniref:Uncharacterized protein n=1 Tax=Marinobacter vulgaris TaxID=1928331 RepID=A0A2V3ZH72_9GAMM|nr:hypothetical protein DIT71_15415 [Marinobacter vulgaris]TSJ68209.1 hypothetical protein FPC41_15770 [Marinobacter vulgaris]
MSDSGSLKSARWFRHLVALAILFALWWFLLGVLERELQRAEEQSANMVISQLRSALVIKGAEVMLDRQQSLEDHEGINPFELIDHQWGSYAGQCEGDIPEPSNWCFRDGTQKETVKQSRGWLIYNPNQPITLQDRQANAGEPLAWTVATEFADRNQNGQREQNERSTGLRLMPVSLTEESADTQSAAR